jgi:putative DNA primase/helicase
LTEWATAASADPCHPYLVHKGLAAPHGARQIGKRLMLAFSVAGRVTTLQFISPDGSKPFLEDGRKAGSYFAIGGPLRSVLVIAEGFATGASIFEATSLPVAVAGDAGNLEPVARSLISRHADVRFVIAGDNDASRVGEVRGREAAVAVDGVFLMPDEVGLDFNDLAQRDGLQAISAVIGRVL